jgi:FimV-like protein
MQEKCAVAAIALFCLLSPARPQGLTTVRGELKCENCHDFMGYTVELQDVNRLKPGEQLIVHSGGEFEVRVPEGHYRLLVSVNGELVKSDFVTVREHFTALSVSLPPANQASKPGTGTVSIARLQHKVPKQAAKELKRAQNLFEAGDVDGSLEHLERATEIDPEYLEAWNNIGCRYMAKKEPAEAAAAFGRAITLDPGARLVHANMGLALIALGRFGEAEESARKGLAVDSRDVKARYVLGISLLGQGRVTDETVTALRDASEAFPRAQLALAQALAQRGDREGARAVLRNHLSSREADTRKQAEAMLSNLR